MREQMRFHAPLPHGGPVRFAGFLKNPALGTGAFDTLIPTTQTLILSRRVSAVSKDGERISPFDTRLRRYSG